MADERDRPNDRIAKEDKARCGICGARPGNCDH